jgi:hypothetical protein
MGAYKVSGDYSKARDWKRLQKAEDEAAEIENNWNGIHVDAATGPVLNNAGFKVYVANRLMDRVFHAENDLVVPTASAYETNGSGFFPIEDRYLFPPSDAVHHCNYFSQAVAREKILDWLR